jgi:uncharacterized protein with PQ loop repeat
MNLTLVLGIIGIGINWALFLIGFPHQIIKNYRRKSTEGLSRATYIMWFAAFLLNELYAIAISNVVLILGSLPAVFFLGTILVQMAYYRSGTPKTQ